MDKTDRMVTEMAEDFDQSSMVRGFCMGAEATIRELQRQGLIPAKEAQQDG